MTYFYAGMCLIVGLILIFKMRKEHKIFAPLGIFLILMGAWIIANEALNGLLSTGIYWYVEKGALAIAAIILIIIYVKDYNKNTKEFNEKNNK